MTLFFDFPRYDCFVYQLGHIAWQKIFKTPATLISKGSASNIQSVEIQKQKSTKSITLRTDMRLCTDFIMTRPSRPLVLDSPDDFILPKSTLMQKFSVQIIGKRLVTFWPAFCKTSIAIRELSVHSVQHGHLSTLIKVFTIRLSEYSVLSHRLTV